MRHALRNTLKLTQNVSRATKSSLKFKPSLIASRSSSSKDSSSTTSTSDQSESNTSNTSKSASAYLLAQAEVEEAMEEVRKPPKIPELQEIAWDGDEPQDRAIRRILEDSYKPLRVKGFKKEIPTLAPLPSSLFTTSPSSSSTPSTEGTEPKKVLHPWEVTFKPPDSYRPVSRSQTYLASRISSPSTSKSPLATPKRLAIALERSKDYEAGFVTGSSKSKGRGALVPEGYEEESEKNSSAKGTRRGAVGGGMRGWDGIVEEKIQQAIRDGLFKKIEGRGKPRKQDEAESNPFIARDEFLINRIVKSQGAAPPWVDLQIDLEQAASAFRSELRSTWSRRAIRMLSLGGVTRNSLSQIRNGWTDPEWEAREKAYHEEAVKSINSVTRRYNGVAPYHVRRASIALHNELESCYKDCASNIEKELARRMSGAVDQLPVMGEKGEKVTKGKESKEEEGIDDDNIWRALRRVVKEVFGSSK